MKRLAPTLGDRLGSGAYNQAGACCSDSPHSPSEHSLKKQQEAAVLRPHHLGYWTEAERAQVQWATLGYLLCGDTGV